MDEPNSSVFWIVLFLLGCLLFFMKTGCPFLETEGQNFWSLFYAEYKEIGIAVLSVVFMSYRHLFSQHTSHYCP